MVLVTDPLFIRRCRTVINNSNINIAGIVVGAIVRLRLKCLQNKWNTNRKEVISHEYKISFRTSTFARTNVNVNFYLTYLYTYILPY